MSSIIVYSSTGTLLLLLLLSFLSFAMSQSSLYGGLNYIDNYCPSDEDNTASGNYMHNVGRLFSQKLYDGGNKSIDYGEYPDKVYGLYLCRFDITGETCHNCIAQATDYLVKECMSNKTAIIWFAECMVRYSNVSFFSTLEMDPGEVQWIATPVTYPEVFNEILNQTFNKAIAMLSASNYATQNVTISNNETLYSLVQCIPDLSRKDCRACLNHAMKDMFKGSRGVIYLNPCCNMRYELYGDTTPTVAAPAPNTPSNNSSNTGDWESKRKKESRAWIIPITITASAIVVVLLSYFLWRMLRKNTRDEEESANSQEVQSIHLRDGRMGNECSDDALQRENRVESQEFPSFPLGLALEATQNFCDENNRTVIIVVCSVVGSVILILFIGCSIFFRMRKTEGDYENMKEIQNRGSLQFNFSTIRDATDNFSDANKLGQGGFGAVYKGMLSDGEQIAVKRLAMNSKQGDLEFKNEVIFVAKLQHRNLVRLLGFCLERKERILVYEFLPNSSLDHFIFDPIKREFMQWEKRYKIIEGIARGLQYLHEDSRLRIIHRDLKTSNVLLDSELNPKISDFGMARLFEMDQTQSDTNRVVGTFGYMAPEYVQHGRISVKSDVYSFGALVLEIMSGQKISSFGTEEETEGLLSYAWKNWNEGTDSNVLDPTLRDGSTDEMKKCIHIGLLCVQENVSDRPTMGSVVVMLNSENVTLPAPSKPGFFLHNSVTHEASSSSSSSRNCYSGSTKSDQVKNEVVPVSRNDVTITELHPR